MVENEKKELPQDVEELMKESFQSIKLTDQIPSMETPTEPVNVYNIDDPVPLYGIGEGDEDEDTNKKTIEKSVNNSRLWSNDDDIYRPVSNTVKRLKAGYYTFNSSQDMGFYFKKEEVNLNKLYFLPNKASETIMKDISDFWTLKERYDKYERVFKRNYLMYSAPGTGKTSIINLMCKNLIEQYDGIVFMINDETDLNLSSTGLKIMHQVEPDRKMILLIEDIDNYISSHGGGRSSEAYLLQLLDGNIKVPNLVVIATTNYIDRLQERFTNRPSRFDRVLEYPLPNDISRKIFIENTVLPEDLTKINVDNWVKRTEGFTIDHINEVIVLHLIHGYTEEDSFAAVESMVENNDTLRNRDSVDANKHTIGFGSIKKSKNY